MSKKEQPEETKIAEPGNEPGNEPKEQKKYGPRDYLVKAAELLKGYGESRNINVAQNAIEEALLFIGKEGL